MSHRSLRSTLVPFASGLAAVIAVVGVPATTPAFGATSAAAAVRAQEWWLADLHVTQVWPRTEGAGITVAVLGTGVAAGHPDLTGHVITGPDYTGSGRRAGGPFWGIGGTAAASVIAGHGHGAGDAAGITGVAPAANILSIRVSLEFNDPLNADPALTRRLPGAIASGITYAVDHGARVIDLPLDPGTFGPGGQGYTAAAGGSPAEQEAVAYALRRGAVLVAPAGDDAQGASLVNYPAAYTGVIAVGAVSRGGHLAPFSSTRSYVALTAPGADLVAATATPPGGYAPISSTSTASGIVAGVAALILARYPQLSAAQVTRALTMSAGAASAGTASGGAAARARRAAARRAAARRAPPPKVRPPRGPVTAPWTRPGRSTWPPLSARPGRAARPPHPRPSRPGGRPRTRRGPTPAPWPGRWSATSSSPWACSSCCSSCCCWS